jgi:hypothetical protein
MDPAPCIVEGWIMPAPVSRPVRTHQHGTLWWLPSGGQGNGLGDAAWAPVLDVPAGIVAPLLAAFSAARVPAYAAQPDPFSRCIDRRVGARRGWRIWVGTSAYGRAEDVLLSVMPALADLSGHHKKPRNE